MLCAIGKQYLVGPIFMDDTITNQRYLQQLHNEVIPFIQRARRAGNIFHQDGVRSHTAEVVLGVLHVVSGSRVL
jgi:hypothetical protein